MFGCESEDDPPTATTAAATQPPVTMSLPKFEDYPAPEIFAGTPAEVNLATARGEEVQAICDFLINLIQLDRAVGRTSSLLEPSP